MPRTQRSSPAVLATRKRTVATIRREIPGAASKRLAKLSAVYEVEDDDQEYEPVRRAQPRKKPAARRQTTGTVRTTARVAAAAEDYDEDDEESGEWAGAMGMVYGFLALVVIAVIFGN